MTVSKKSPASQLQRGFSLIELMISITIGLVIAVAAMSAYQGAAGSSKMADAQSRMNEDAQSALRIIASQIRMAGSNPERIPAPSRYPVYVALPTSTWAASPTSTWTTTVAPSGFSVRGCNGTFTDITTATNLDNLNCTGGTTTLPDAIAVNYEADRYNTSPTAGGIPTDCLGNGLTGITATSGLTTTTPIYYVADNRYFIATTAGRPSLKCKGNGGASTAQPLVENVEDLQLVYGTVSTTATSTTATIAGYLRADEVAGLTTTPANDSERWRRVLVVRVCVVVASETPVAPDAASARYYNCANPPVLTDAPDLRLRRAYSTTVVLRNRTRNSATP